MNLYETVFLFTGNLTEKLANEKLSIYEEILTKNKGKIVKKEYWGLRSLAYKIKKNSKAHYFLLIIESKPESMIDLEEKLKIDDSFLRFLKLRINEIPKEPSIILKKYKEEG